MKNNIFVITGPTAVGKTALSVALCEKIGGEILCMDAFQVYQGMPILSATPSKEQKEKILHHGFEFLSVKSQFSLSLWYEMAEKWVEDVLNRGKIPVFTGGTGLYLRILLNGFEAHAPGADEELRQELTRFAQSHGNDALYQRLKVLNPKRACELHPNDLKRVIRALELCQSENFCKSSPRLDRMSRFCPQWRILCVNGSREKIYNRIEQRIEKMIADGLEKEVSKLLDLGICPQDTAWQAIGLKETALWLKGKISRQEWLEIFCRNTRRFAKRQLTWMNSFADKKEIDFENLQKGLEDDKTLSWLDLGSVFLEFGSKGGSKMAL